MPNPRCDGKKSQYFIIKSFHRTKIPLVISSAIKLKTLIIAHNSFQIKYHLIIMSLFECKIIHSFSYSL